MGNMGNQASSPERDVYELMKALLKKHGKTVSGHDLKIILKWVQVKMPTVTSSTIFTKELWDTVGVKLWDAATTGNVEAQRMLPWWRSIFEVLKAQESSHKNDSDKNNASPSQSPSLPETGQPPLTVGAAGCSPPDDPYDPGPIDPEKEPDLFPPDPHDVWANIRRQAIKEGDLDIAKTIVAPVIYQRGGGGQWEALSFSVVKELRRTVTEHGLSSPYFASLLSSVFDTYVMTPHDLKSLAHLLLTPTQYTLWEAQWKGGLQALLLTYVGHNNAAIAALTLATAHTVTLSDSSVHLLSTNVSGPLPPKTQALLIGRSSTTLSGLFVLPGVIDSDSNETIKIMAWTPSPPCIVPGGSRIAQLILTPTSTNCLNSKHLQQRRGGFGSTGTPQILWVHSLSQKRPMCQCTLIRGDQKVVLNGIIDTGADVTVISQAKWPP